MKKQDYSSSAYVKMADQTASEGKIKFFNLPKNKVLDVLTNFPDSVGGIASIAATLTATVNVDITNEDIASMANTELGDLTVTVPTIAQSSIPVVGGTGVGMGGGSTAGPEGSGY